MRREEAGLKTGDRGWPSNSQAHGEAFTSRRNLVATLALGILTNGFGASLEIQLFCRNPFRIQLERKANR